MINWIAKHWNDEGRLYRVVVLYAGDKKETVYESISPEDLDSMAEDMINTLPEGFHILNYADDVFDRFTFVYVNHDYYVHRFGF